MQVEPQEPHPASSHTSVRHPRLDFLEEEDSLQPDQPQEEELGTMPYTITADLTSHPKFLARQGKYTVIILLTVFLLKILPSPLLRTTFQNDPLIFQRQPCPESAVECSDVEEGYESIAIKKVNPLQRQLKYFVRLNFEQMESLSQHYGPGKVNLNEEITWIEIYASRDGRIYGEVIQEIDGEDIYEILFDEQALIFLGEVHILEEQSYLIKIYKKIRQVTVPIRRLDELTQIEGGNSTAREEEDGEEKTEQGEGEVTNGIQTTAAGNSTLPISTNSSTNSSETTSNSTESALNSSETASSNSTTESNSTKTNKTQPEPVPEPVPEPIPVPTEKTIAVSVPLTVQIVRYSQFYSGLELVVRYVLFLVTLYVRADTPNSPVISHVILMLVANPLIFIEIAFPNYVTNCISNVCSSAHIAYLAIFLYYLRRPLKHRTANIVLNMLKALLFTALFVINVLRQLHMLNQTRISLVEAVLMLLVLLPLVHSLWNMFFLRGNTVMHRHMLFIALTVFYLVFLFLSGYIVQYGWKKIVFYLIVQAYGIELCYLTAPVPQSPTALERQMPVSAQHGQVQVVLSAPKAVPPHPQQQPISEGEALVAVD